MIVVNPTQSSLALAARHSPGIPRQNRPTRVSHSTFDFRPSTSFFSHYYALSCAAQNPNSFRFIFFRTLCTKHPGWGYPTFANSLFSPLDQLVTRHSFTPDPVGHSPLSPLGATLTEKQGRGCQPTTQHRSAGPDTSCPLSFSCPGIARQPRARFSPCGAWRRCCRGLAGRDRRGPSSRK
jgi:hypothetical protein